MTDGTGILTKVLNVFLFHLTFGMNNVKGGALSLFNILVVLEITFLGIWWAFSGGDQIGKLIKRVLVIGFFSYVLNNYLYLTNVIINGFSWTGQKAAGVGQYNDMLLNPSKIVEAGVNIAEPLLKIAANQAGIFSGFGTALILVICALCILVAFTILALQVLITRIEFALVTTLGLILVPFGIFKHTSFLAEKVFGGIISFGVKLMVLSFVITVAWPIMSQITIGTVTAESFYEQIYGAVGAITIAILAVHAPGMAAGLLSGAPSLGAGALAAPVAGMMAGAMGGAALAYSGGKAIFGAGKSGLSKAASALGGATSSGSGGVASNNPATGGSAGGATTSGNQTKESQSTLGASDGGGASGSQTNGQSGISSPLQNAIKNQSSGENGSLINDPSISERFNKGVTSKENKENNGKGELPNQKSETLKATKKDDTSKNDTEETNNKGDETKRTDSLKASRTRAGLINKMISTHSGVGAVLNSSNPSGSLHVPIEKE